MTRLTRLGIVLGAALVLLLSGCGGEETLAGIERDPIPIIDSVTMPAVNRPVDDFAFRAEPDKLLVVTFGFTSCPDICPTTLADLSKTFDDLGDQADDVDLAWVSIDPERDDAAATTTYVEAFIPDGIALRTDDELELALAADAFSVTYIIQESEDGGEPEVAHTANIFVVDDEGNLVLTWPFGVPSKDMTSDLNVLLDRRS